jgi:hypothetical protein
MKNSPTNFGDTEIPADSQYERERDQPREMPSTGDKVALGVVVVAAVTFLYQVMRVSYRVVFDFITGG